MSNYPLKIVAVGTGGVGKSCMLFTYAQGEFPNEYQQSSYFEVSERVHQMDGEQIRVSLWDTAGQEDYDRLRPFTYPETNVFLLLFSVVSPDSFDLILSKFKPELELHCPGVPFILVGSKIDLRDDPTTLERLQERGLGLIAPEQGLQLALEVGACAYMEISSLNNVGIRELFDGAIRSCQATGDHKSKRGGCSIA